MANIKTGSGITKIKGSMSGNVFRHSQYGQHIQATPRTVKKEPTDAQRKRRNAYRTCQNYIHANVTPELVQAWTAYAEQHPHTNKLGQKIILGWLQQFMSINIIRVYNDCPILQDPPE